MRTTCPECQHATQLEKISLEFERQGVTAVVHGIPAMVCPLCGRQYLDGPTSGELTERLRGVVDAVGNLLGKTVEVRGANGKKTHKVSVMEGVSLFASRTESRPRK